MPPALLDSVPIEQTKVSIFIKDSRLTMVLCLIIYLKPPWSFSFLPFIFRKSITLPPLKYKYLCFPSFPKASNSEFF